MSHRKIESYRTRYNFIVRPHEGSRDWSHETNGTLKDAVELAKMLNAKVILTNKAGSVKGFVHPDGNYVLN